MGSDRENLGAPTPMGQMGVPQAQAVDWKTLAKISPQSPGNGISESLDLKIFPVSPGPPRLVHIRRSTHAFRTSTRGGAFENFEWGSPD